MNYLITIAVQFFRWALAWVARELVLLIVMALVSNFFAEFRQLLLHFMDLIKDKILILFKQIETLSNDLESSIKKISSNIEKLSTKVNNFNIFLVEKLDQVKTSLSKIINRKTQQIKNILDNRVLSRLNEIRADLNNLNIDTQERANILRKLTLAEKGINKVISTADDLNSDMNTIVDKKLNQITNKIPTLPNIETTELSKQMEKLNTLIAQSNQAINEEIDFIFSKFTEEQVRNILEAQILNADDEVFDNASDIVSSKVKKKIKTPNAKKIKWLKLKHNKKANTEHADKFKINDIYRILVDNFDRDERIALALRFAKKDHFRLKD
jgi:predicted PurR-regulated permease PerM